MFSLPEATSHHASVLSRLHHTDFPAPNDTVICPHSLFPSFVVGFFCLFVFLIASEFYPFRKGEEKESCHRSLSGSAAGEEAPAL